MDVKNCGLDPDKYTVLNPLSEALVLTTNSDNRNIILGALEISGPVDIRALRETAKGIGQCFPQLKACLKELKIRGKHCLVCNHQGSPEIPLLINSAYESGETTYGFDALLKQLEPSLARKRDFFSQPACEIHLLRLAEDRHLLACILEHRASDAITLAEIVKVFMANYHESVTGEKSIFYDYPSVASTAAKRRIARKQTVLRDYSDTFAQAMIPYKRCALPHGHGNPDQRCEHYVKCLPSVDRTNSILMNCSRTRAPFVDFLMAGVALAIDRWNNARNVKSSRITGAMTVNIQGRFIGDDGPNNDSVLYFELEPEQRNGFRKLARTIYHSRTRLFRDHMDIKYFKGMKKINNVLRLFPFRSRQRAYLEMLERHQTSFALGFMGVLWPENSGRKISNDSFLTSAGGLNIVEAHGMAYRIVSRTPLYLAAYFFRKRLNLILSAAAWLFTEEEAQSFLDLVVEVLELHPPEETRL